MGQKVVICGINTSELPTLKSKELYELLLKVKNGDELARQEFIYSNMKLVLSVVQRFSRRKESMDDLFQVGCVGLIKAIDNFNVNLGVKFSTYAVPMIIGEIRRFIRDNSTVRVSRSLRDIAYKALKAREELGAFKDYEPSLDEIAEKINTPIFDVVCALDAISETVSLEEPAYNDGGNIVVIDQIGDNRSIDTLENLAIKQAIKKLSDREKQILLLRYYIGKTQVEISDEVGISQAQVSRLEKTALASIKKSL